MISDTIASNVACSDAFLVGLIFNSNESFISPNNLITTLVASLPALAYFCAIDVVVGVVFVAVAVALPLTVTVGVTAL